MQIYLPGGRYDGDAVMHRDSVIHRAKECAPRTRNEGGTGRRKSGRVGKTTRSLFVGAYTEYLVFVGHPILLCSYTNQGH